MFGIGVIPVPPLSFFCHICSLLPTYELSACDISCCFWASRWQWLIAVALWCPQPWIPCEKSQSHPDTARLAGGPHKLAGAAPISPCAVHSVPSSRDTETGHTEVSCVQSVYTTEDAHKWIYLSCFNQEMRKMLGCRGFPCRQEWVGMYHSGKTQNVTQYLTFSDLENWKSSQQVRFHCKHQLLWEIKDIHNCFSL